MFSDPAQNIKELGLEPGMKVADFGAGSGHYSIAAARAVSGAGRVYALDIQKDLLNKIKLAASQEHLTNIEVLWGDAEKPGGSSLKEASVDAVIVSNLLFQIENKKNFALEVKRVLKPKGRALVVDWTDSFSGMGPAASDVFLPVAAKQLFESAGFALEREFRAGAHHYGIIFKKP